MVGVAPPAAQSAPQPPVLTTARGLGPPLSGELESTLDSPAAPSAEPRSISPAPWERDSTVDRIEAAVAPHGDRVVRAPVSSPDPTPSLRARAEQSPLMRQLAIIAGTGTAIAGVITALGSAVTNILAATRPATALELEEKISELRKRLDANQGQTLEAKTRQEKDEELAEQIEKLRARMRRLEPRDTIQGLPSNQPPR